MEPYVLAADVYSVAPHEGRGGWTWYTGSAAWMYRAGIEGLLGLTREGPDLFLNPCFAKDWPQLRANVRLGGMRLSITIHNPGQTGHGIQSATLNSVSQDLHHGRVRVDLSNGDQNLVITLK